MDQQHAVHHHLSPRTGGGGPVRILVIADSHGDTSSVRQAIGLHPDVTRVLHCGDGEADVIALRSAFPSLSFDAVRGNCDLGGVFPLELLLRIRGRRIFMTHGHCYGAKVSMESLLEQGRAARADAVLFGHTHHPLIERRDGILLVNPGSIAGRFPARAATYAILELSASGVTAKAYEL